MKNMIQKGDVITWTNGTGAAVASGQVVKVGSMLAIATAAIADGAVGEVALTGVFEVPKVSAAVIAAGEEVIWDDSASAFDDSAATPATGDVSGAAIAVEAAGDGVTTINVHLNARLGTVA